MGISCRSTKEFAWFCFSLSTRTLCKHELSILSSLRSSSRWRCQESDLWDHRLVLAKCPWQRCFSSAERACLASSSHSGVACPLLADQHRRASWVVTARRTDHTLRVAPLMFLPRAWLAHQWSFQSSSTSLNLHVFSPLRRPDCNMY